MAATHEVQEDGRTNESGYDAEGHFLRSRNNSRTDVHPQQEQAAHSGSDWEHRPMTGSHEQSSHVGDDKPHEPDAAGNGHEHPDEH